MLMKAQQMDLLRIPDRKMGMVFSYPVSSSGTVKPTSEDQQH